MAYTDPEIAWAGITETEAKARGIQYGKGMFPWAASGRSLALNRDEGFTKLLFDKETHRVIGAGMVGTNAGDLIAEVALAIEMGADASDIGLTIHPHPTLSETVAFAAEAFDGTLDRSIHPEALGDPQGAVYFLLVLCGVALGVAASRRSPTMLAWISNGTYRRSERCSQGPPSPLAAGTDPKSAPMLQLNHLYELKLLEAER